MVTWTPWHLESRPGWPCTPLKVGAKASHLSTCRWTGAKGAPSKHHTWPPCLQEASAETGFPPGDPSLPQKVPQGNRPSPSGLTKCCPLRNFVEEKMGSKFVEGRSVEFSKSYEESSPSTPIFFILSPGVDPLKDVEALGKCGQQEEASQVQSMERDPSTPSSRASA